MFDIGRQLALARTLMDVAWQKPGKTWKANYEEATSLLEKIVANHPDNAAALVNLGVALSDQGFHKRALKYYRQAESLN